jgi:DNA-binding IscR family transcriptional regulator
VTSHRGVKGGYVLEREAEKINLAELIEALDHPLCFLEPKSTIERDLQVHGCPIQGALTEIHGRIREMLRGVTLAELLQPAGPADGLQIGLDLFVRGRELAEC